MGTEERRNSGCRVTEEPLVQSDSGDQRNSGYRGTVGTEEQWVQRNSKYRGTMGTEGQWVRGDSR